MVQKEEELCVYLRVCDGLKGVQAQLQAKEGASLEVIELLQAACSNPKNQDCITQDRATMRGVLDIVEGKVGTSSDEIAKLQIEALNLLNLCTGVAAGREAIAKQFNVNKNALNKLLKM